MSTSTLSDNRHICPVPLPNYFPFLKHSYASSSSRPPSRFSTSRRFFGLLALFYDLCYATVHLGGPATYPSLNCICLHHDSTLWASKVVHEVQAERRRNLTQQFAFFGGPAFPPLQRIVMVMIGHYLLGSFACVRA
jgi:hypothetical protein